MVKNINERKQTTGDLTTTKLFENNDDWTFQQDGASSHTATNVQRWLSNNVKTFIPKNEWPGNSPDINAIENANRIGFAGLAFYSDLWKKKDPVAEFNNIVEKFQELNIPIE